MSKQLGIAVKKKRCTLSVRGAIRIRWFFVQERMDAKGDYVIALKGNQGKLQEDIKNHEMTNENNDKGHGRLEQRVAAIANDMAWLSLL